MLPAFVALCIQRQRHTRVVHSIVLTLWSSWLPGGGGPESHHWDLSKEHLGFLSSDPGTINQNQFSRFITLICYTCHAHTHACTHTYTHSHTPARMHSHTHTYTRTDTYKNPHPQYFCSYSSASVVLFFTHSITEQVILFAPAQTLGCQRQSFD